MACAGDIYRMYLNLGDYEKEDKMVGICSYGAYVPFYRVTRESISKAWGGAAMPGEKAVANFDEDSITLAVEAAVDCLKGVDRNSIDGLFFASTTSPYREKQAAATIACALDLRSDIITQDYANSLRAGTNALRSATDAVKAGSAKKVLVVAADCRQGIPKSSFEQNFGDGAAALLIGETDVAVDVEWCYSITDEIIDLWRRDEDKFVRSWEDRFAVGEGYETVMVRAITEALKQHGATSKDFSKAAIYGPDSRNLQRATAAAGLDVKSQVQSNLFNLVGNTGAALSLMLLVAALEDATANSKILLASYGNGSDVFSLQVTDKIETIKDRNAIKKNLASKDMLPYEQYLTFRKILPVEAPRRPKDISSPSILHRDRATIVRAYASKCRHCGTMQYPLIRVCPDCLRKDDFDKVRISDRKGTIFTFSLDNLAASANPPTAQVVVDLEGEELKLLGTLTDRYPQEISVGTEVELTFRIIFDNDGVINYAWKIKPTR